MLYDIVIVGAGASGMMAGIAAASFLSDSGRTYSIAIIERQPYAGRKLLATGNGQCNISNKSAVAGRADEFYYGGSSEDISLILDALNPIETIKFFENLGVQCYSEPDGKVYPLCKQALAVRDALISKISELGITLLTNTEVTNIYNENSQFVFSLRDNANLQDAIVKSTVLILTTGGKASPMLSSDGSGYALCTSLGHTLTGLYPAIVKLVVKKYFERNISGVKINAHLSIIRRTVSPGTSQAENIILGSDSGELLFTDNGISGPPVLALSHLIGENEKHGTIFCAVDLCPEYSQKHLAEIFTTRSEMIGDRGISAFFDGILPLKLAHAAANKIFGNSSGKKIGDATALEIAKAIALMKNLTLQIIGTDGWMNAQVTGGGIPLDEVDCSSMESLKCGNLFLAGEILETIGDCGGYNLQFAWSGGYLAGISAGKLVNNTNTSSK